MSTDPSEKMILLRTSDGETFQVEEAAAQQSQTIKNIIEDGCADSGIPLPNVTGKIMAKIVEYLNRHQSERDPKPSDDDEDPKPSDDDEDHKAFDAEFMKVDTDTLFDLLVAANYLDIKSLLDLSSQTAADMMKGKTAEQIRKTFNIKNDFTPEEEEEVRRENAWAFE